MLNDTFADLLTDIHRSIDRVAEELAHDRPALADALRRRAAWIPRPEELARGKPISEAASPALGSDGACRSLPPLLYHALDEGVLTAQQFDALMLDQSRASRVLRERTT